MTGKLSNFDKPIQYPLIDESETDLCRALWIAAPVQAVIDAKSKRKRQEHQQAKQEALEWLEAKEGEASDFAEVCDLAGLDFQLTRERLLELVRDENAKVSFSCLKKAMMCNRGNEARSKYLKRMRRHEKQRADKIKI